MTAILKSQSLRNRSKNLIGATSNSLIFNNSSYLLLAKNTKVIFLI